MSWDLVRDKATGLFWIIEEEQTGYEYDTNACEHEIRSVRGPISPEVAAMIQYEDAVWDDIESQDDDALLGWACNADLEHIGHLADDPITCEP